MTRHFPAKCVEHPDITIWNVEGIIKHREQYDCNADILSIASKEFRKWREKQGKVREKP